MSETEEESRDLRYRKLFFPNSEHLAFNPESGGAAPVPILLRKIMRQLSASEFRVLVYLHLCASRFGVCAVSLEEMVYDLGLSGNKHVKPHLRSLEEKRFISVHSAPALGKTFVLIHDVRFALGALIEKGEWPEADLLAIHDLCEELKLPPVQAPEGGAARKRNAGRRAPRPPSRATGAS